MKKISIISMFFIISIFIQWHFDPAIKKEFIASLLTVFSMFFGFYITSFAVFSTSKYLSKLYKIQDKLDSRNTLLHSLIENFKWPAYLLLCSISYLIIIYIFIENKTSYLYYFTYIVWGVISLNIFYIYKTIDIFIKVTLQSAKHE